MFKGQVSNQINLNTVFYRALKMYNESEKTDTNRCQKLISIIDRTECGTRSLSASQIASHAKMLNAQLDEMEPRSGQQMGLF